MSLTTDLARYVCAHRRFVFRACTRGVEMGEHAPEYDRLEKYYTRAVNNRPWLAWIMGRRWGMRIILSWIN